MEQKSGYEAARDAHLEYQRKLADERFANKPATKEDIESILEYKLIPIVDQLESILGQVDRIVARAEAELEKVA